MQQAKVDVFVAHFCYGGNGGIKSLAAPITPWWAKTYYEMMQDDRIGRVGYVQPGDIPLDMERNRTVEAAMQDGYDLLFMLDSDNIPDLHLPHGEPHKPFWQTSFDFAYSRLTQGKPTAICAPYCGPPPHPIELGMENVYVFYWEALSNDQFPQHVLQMYSREHACQMRGITPVAAGPTGCILYTMSAFELLQVQRVREDDILELLQRQAIDVQTAKRLLSAQSYFYYEFRDQRRIEKVSTEDVTNLRDISLAGFQKYGEDIVFCNWDSWAGHAKPKVVGKPAHIRVEQINEHYRRAVESNVSAYEHIVEADFPIEPVKSPAAQSDNGKPRVITRTICGVPVRSVLHQTHPDELQELANIVAIKAKEKPDKQLKIIEIGSWVGESAIAMSTGLGPAGGEIYCIDHFRGNEDDHTGEWAQAAGGEESLVEHFKQNVGERLDKTIKLIQSDSLSVAKNLTQPTEADIIFIDGEHTYEACKADIEAWLPHLAKDGWLMGHDYSRIFPGVVQAVDELFHDVEVRLAG
ncbi:MAG: class I SAM-dependent methyltransferase, partial [Planctomycetota bacterium]